MVPKGQSFHLSYCLQLSQSRPHQAISLDTSNLHTTIPEILDITYGLGLQLRELRAWPPKLMADDGFPTRVHYTQPQPFWWIH